ncbi:hypothetical protein C1H46_027248 [Malus baccata]|uniref:Uncharacterized protein n=1 Tax=Malus baccata TaxID=106549 RepID=A0A540LL60_MALBA|nr:hypothetical protein C1H46_027248 [Malus baccata]
MVTDLRWRCGCVGGDAAVLVEVAVYGFRFGCCFGLLTLRRDQKVVAEVAEICGLGIWEKSWPWSGDREKKLVKGDEIAVKIKELMESDSCADRRSG